jgi:hypothetical protein
MKKKSTSQSAFFNLRILAGLLVGMTGVSLALFGANPFGHGNRPSASVGAKAQQKYKVTTKSQSITSLVPPGFDCSKIRQLGIDKMENLRAGAIMIFCGQATGGSASPGHRAFSKLVQSLMAPLAYGGTDVDLITGTETPPHVIQSETFTTANPDNPNEIVVAYNDSRGAETNNFSGASVSTDGGLTFTRLTTGSGQSPFPNTSGDPVILYNKPSGTWFTVWIFDGLCGGGLGGYKSTTPEDPNSWTHYTCVNPNSFDDRESGWADNNPASPFFGNMYVSWNDFDVSCGAGGCIFVVRSTDNGATWSSPVQVTFGGAFIRNVQITGDLATGDVYIAGMDEETGGFGLGDRFNTMYKSTDGGNTWANTYSGPAFPAAGRVLCPNTFFACMYPNNGGYWRHQSWGQPAALNGIVHYVYGSRDTGNGDPGNVFYIRSTDGGVTFSAPLMLNTDGDPTKAQWQANLSVSDSGTLLAVWYDERNGGNCTPGSNTPCYQMWARKSLDNGATWLPDDAFSDVVSPLPAQDDPFIITEYVGDYDYGSALPVKHLTSWVDGRVAVGGSQQQDAFTDRDLVGFAVVSADPACGSVVFTQPTEFDVNLTAPVDPSTVQASDFEVNGTPADSFALSNGDQTITFTFNSSPVVNQGEQTMHIPAGAFNQASNNDPVLEFQCTFRYDALQLEVTDTVPPVGGNFTLPPQDQDLEVNFNEEVDPNSVQTSDLQLSGINGATVTNVTVSPDNLTATFTINFPTLGSLTASIPAGAIADQFGNPNAEFSGNYTVGGCVPDAYVITPGTDPIVPGDTNIGSDCDDCGVQVSLPFPFQLYGTTYNTVNVRSNGRLEFVNIHDGDTQDYVSVCLPAPPDPITLIPYDFTIFGLWEDQLTFASNPGCAAFPGGTCGIFTSVSGSEPNRIFNIEWRTVLFNDTNAPQNHEIRLYENDPNQRFDVIIGTLTPQNADQMWVSGVQGANLVFTQDFCIPAGGSPPTNVSRAYEIQPCTSPTPTPTPSVTPSATPTATPTATPGHSPTPRPRPTPHPRPTP